MLKSSHIHTGHLIKVARSSAFMYDWATFDLLLDVDVFFLGFGCYAYAALLIKKMFMNV